MRLLMLGILMGFPLLEGAVLYTLGQDHGGWVVGWLLFAGIAGIVLIKQARFSLITRLAGELSRGQFSLAAIIDSFRTVLAGLLLIFPGIISDVMALVLLLLPVREPAYQFATTRANRGATPQSEAQRGGVIEGEFRRER
ncbi:MAG: FxsA family protein [Burkholderiales bacterium]|nr:FxsA family protein [Burkholderiales bacterium]